MRRFLLALLVLTLMMFSAPMVAACAPEPITANTPTGISGCEVWGEGIGSHYGPGGGVAMNFCTWERRHSLGCGFATITSLDTGLSGTFPIVDFCDCYTGTANQRVVDMQFGVLAALGLSTSKGLYAVNVQPSSGQVAPAQVAPAPVEIVLPDTAMEKED
jgi:hypothetical protein